MNKVFLITPIIALLVMGTMYGWISYAGVLPLGDRVAIAKANVEKQLQTELSHQGLKYSSPIFIRIFKQEAELELWVEAPDNTFKLFKTYPICDFSGQLGPKQKEGDRQAPEGFYFVTRQQLNPKSRFHLSFNLGYPNAYDRAHQRTGSALMVHGDCVSIGCYAMTDDKIEEIYLMAHQALHNGQDFFRVHIFPFRYNQENKQKYANNPWMDFWKNLEVGYDWFEEHKRPPNVEVVNKRYIFEFDTVKKEKI